MRRRKTANIEIARATQKWNAEAKRQGWDDDIRREGLRMLLGPTKAAIARAGKKHKSKNRSLPLLDTSPRF